MAHSPDKDSPVPGPQDFSSLLKYNFLLIARGAGFVKRVFRQRLLLIGCLALLGLGLGYLRYAIGRRLYLVSMHVTQADVSKKIFADKVQTLNGLIKSRSYETLAKDLRISPAMARSLSLVEAFNLFDVPLEKDTSSKGAFCIKFELLTNRHLDSLQNGMMQYLNDVEYINRVKQARLQAYKEKLKFLDNQLAQLDSFKLSYASFMAQKGNASINLVANKNDVSELFKESDEMMREKQYIMEQLALHQDVAYLLDGFSVPEHPKKHGLLINLLAFMLAGAALGFMIGFFQTLSREIKA